MVSVRNLLLLIILTVLSEYRYGQIFFLWPRVLLAVLCLNSQVTAVLMPLQLLRSKLRLVSDKFKRF